MSPCWEGTGSKTQPFPRPHIYRELLTSPSTTGPHLGLFRCHLGLVLGLFLAMHWGINAALLQAKLKDHSQLCAYKLLPILYSWKGSGHPLGCSGSTVGQPCAKQIALAVLVCPWPGFFFKDRIPFNWGGVESSLSPSPRAAIGFILGYPLFQIPNTPSTALRRPFKGS